MRQTLAIAWTLVAAAALGGCAEPPRVDRLVFDSPTYAPHFDAAKDVLRDFRFDLDRVDAGSGVITTQPKASSGLATPWIPHSGDLEGSIEGLLEFERRIARVEFYPEGVPEQRPPETFDLRSYEGRIVMRANVTVQRVSRPHRRVSPTSIKFSSYAHDPSVPVRRGEVHYQLDEREDRDLSGRLVRAIEQRMQADSEQEP